MRGVSTNIKCGNILIETHKKILKTYTDIITSDRLDVLYSQACDEYSQECNGVNGLYPLKILFKWEKLCELEVNV